MKNVSLQFKDILQLLEFIEFTKCHQCTVDVEKITLTGEMLEADIELAINGYDAELLGR